MKKIAKKSGIVLFAAVMLFTLVLSGRTSVYAEGTEYISSWAEYSEKNEPAYVEGTWMFHDIKDAIYAVLDGGLSAMESGDYDAAKQAGSDGYYGFYDLAFENATNMYISGSRVSEMELLFSNLRTIAKNQGTYEEYSAVVDTLKANLEEDANMLDGSDLDGGTSDSSETSAQDDTSASTSAATLVFLGCFSIVLREGFEAIIVVGAIIAYLQVKVRAEKTSKRKTLYPVYFGSVLGIICSFIMAWLINLLTVSGANQELIEGITCLIAVCVLFYVCNWMLHKSETEAWTAYIQSKTEAGTSSGSIFALAFTAFLAVFREGAEVVLFFQPYVSDEATRSSVWSGLVIGGIALVFVYVLIHVLSITIPYRLFFNATSVLLAIMCVCFLGSGIKELIEGGVLGSYSVSWLAWIPYNDVLDVLGIYPLLNTIIPQIILAVVLIVLFRIGFKQNREIRIEAQKRREAEEAQRLAIEERQKEAAFRAKVSGLVIELLREREAGASLDELAKKEELIAAAEAAADSDEA